MGELHRVGVMGIRGSFSEEAALEYAKDNNRYPDSMHYRYDNVITLRTFSKIYGLAGVRIGYGFAHEELIGNLLKVKLPFEPSHLGQAAGIAALGDKEWLHRSLELNARGLRLLTSTLTQMGFEVIPSEANFVTIPLENADAAQRTAAPRRDHPSPRCVRFAALRSYFDRDR